VLDRILRAPRTLTFRRSSQQLRHLTRQHLERGVGHDVAILIVYVSLFAAPFIRRTNTCTVERSTQTYRKVLIRVAVYYFGAFVVGYAL
jgi:hypothetical protein